MKLEMDLFSNLNLKYKVLTALIVLLFILLRLHLLQVPHIENTVWKEIDYIQISQNYNKKDVQFWEPTVSWPAEEPRVTAMEFPIVPYITSKLYQLFGFNVYTLRIITLISFILLSVYLYKIVSLLTNDKNLSFLSLVISLTLPLNYLFGRLLFSEPVIVALIIITIYQFLKWKTSDRKAYFIWSFVFLALILLLKPTGMYVLLPLLYIYYRKTGSLNPRNYYRFGLGFALAIVPAMIWYAYAYHLSKVSIDVFSVFGGHNKFQTLAMLSDPSWWNTMYVRFTKLFGGTGMFLIFIIGLFSRIAVKEYRLFYILLIANLSFLFIVAEGHLDAPYRQFAFVAAGAFFIAVGFLALGSLFYKLYLKLASQTGLLPNLNPKILYLGISLLILMNFSYNLIAQSIPKGDSVFHEIAEKLDQIKTENSKLVTVGNYSVHKGGNDLSPVLYHYSNMQGWSLESEDWDLTTIENLKSKGADIFVGLTIYTNEASDFMEEVCKKYPTVHKSDRYVICHLSGTSKKD